MLLAAIWSASPGADLAAAAHACGGAAGGGPDGRLLSRRSAGVALIEAHCLGGWNKDGRTVRAWCSAAKAHSRDTVHSEKAQFRRRAAPRLSFSSLFVPPHGPARGIGCRSRRAAHPMAVPVEPSSCSPLVKACPRRHIPYCAPISTDSRSCACAQV